MANTFNGNMKSRKAFACIMTTKEDTQQILTISNGNTVYANHNNIKQIQAIAEKFMVDFGDAATQWLPDIA